MTRMTAHKRKEWYIVAKNKRLTNKEKQARAEFKKRIRSGAGTDNKVVGAIREVAGKKNKYTIVEEKNGWGRLKSGAGWISLSYTKKAS